MRARSSAWRTKTRWPTIDPGAEFALTPVKCRKLAAACSGSDGVAALRSAKDVPNIHLTRQRQVAISTHGYGAHLALARRVLTLVISAAVALAPLGAAARTAEHMHSDAIPMASQAGVQHQHVAAAEAGKSLHAHMRCRPGEEHAKSDCSQACLQKCFGPLAVMPAGGKAPASAARQFVFAATAAPAGWSSAPQPPPPRT